MTAPVFIDFNPETPITAAWLNSVSGFLWNTLGGGNLPASADVFRAGLAIPQVVQSMALFRSQLTQNSSPWVYLSSYYTDIRSGGGLYQKIANVPGGYVDDGGTLIIVADGSVWQLCDQAELRTETFGIRWDGTTDDTVCWNKAIPAAVALNKILHAPSGYSVTSGAGLVFPAAFPGLIGEGAYKTIIGYVGTGTAITKSPGPIGVYKGWQAQPGLPTDSLATKRGTFCGGIWFQGLGGEGVIENIFSYGFNGFGTKFDDVYDTNAEGIIVQACGNSNNYAFSANNVSNDTNHTNFNRVQVEDSYGKAVSITGLNLVVTGLHSEGTVGDGINTTHAFNGDLTLINGRIEGASNVIIQYGVAFGSSIDMKFGGLVNFSYGARLDAYGIIENCSFASDINFNPGTLRQYKFIGCSIAGSVYTSYVEKDIRFEGTTIDGQVVLQGTGPKVILNQCTVGAGIVSTGGNNSVEIYGGTYEYIPTNISTKIRNATFNEPFALQFGQQVDADSCTFLNSVTIQSSSAKWVSDRCQFVGGIILGSGAPVWKFGPGDYSDILSGIASAPTGGSFFRGERTYNLAPAVGQPQFWWVSATGNPATWTAGPNL